MKLGIKQKIVLVLVGVLALSTALNALLASYFTDRQNKQAAYANLRGDLFAWQADLQALTAQLRSAALATLGDVTLLDQMGELITLEYRLDDVDSRARHLNWSIWTRTQGHRKTVALNRLRLALRTGGFSSIAVYARGRLSHALSAAHAGMSVMREDGHPVWITATANLDGDFPFMRWPAWKEAPMPQAEAAFPEPPSQPRTSFTFPESGDTLIEIAVPVQGYREDLLNDDSVDPLLATVSELSVAGVSGHAASGPASGVNGRTPSIFAVVVFRKLIDRAMLESVAKRTGKLPALLSPDGRHRQTLVGQFPMPSDVENPAAAARRFDGVPAQRIVSVGQQSFYVAWLPWQLDGQPRLVLGLATPTDSTLANIRQTVIAILLVSGATMALGVVVGLWWVGRFMDPIVHLTAAVKRITGRDREGAGAFHAAVERLPPVDRQAPGEVVALAQAFNDMLGELQRSFETLEQRVQSRTAELRQQARYLRTLIDMLPMRAWFKDTESRFLAVNQAEAKACGSSPDGLVGKSDLDVWPPQLAHAYRADDVEVMRSRQGKTVEQTQAVSDGTAWLETFKAPVIDEDGTVLGTVGVARDISERKASEAAREAALAEAQRLARLRSEFLATMSHELRTPLNAILGFAHILQENKSLSDQQTKGLRIIDESGKHLLGLIEDILDLARIDAAKLDLNPTDVHLSTFLLAVCDIVRSNAEAKGLVFNYQTAGPLPQGVRVDERRLRQVLLNLLSNAIKFTDRGQVTLRVQSLPAVAPRDDAARLRFEVHDTGIGLSRAQTERLFQPFEQVAETRRREGGTGLGLTISRQLVRLMGGDVDVQSRPGEGSVFSFQLDVPTAQAPDPALIARGTTTGYAGDRKKVLVVDDVAQNRAMLFERLSTLGFEVVEAQDGQQGVEVASHVRPDLIMMDVMMPVMDGFEATRTLRQQPELADVPVIMTSASITGDMEARSREAGANGFIAKPIDDAVLLSRLACLMGLTWISQEAAHPPKGTVELVYPPEEEMQVLRQLARIGNMRSLRDRAEHLRAKDSRYAAFAARLADLAMGYQSRAIMALVEEQVRT